MGHHVAQVNIALPKAPTDSPLLEDFMAALDPINALADASPGFVWRLQTDDGNATTIRAFPDERLIINMSVWRSIDDLAGFVYRSGHVEVMRRRREWFERLRLFMALWWVLSDHVPTVAEARERLDHLAANGPTPFAFTFKLRFPPPDGDAEPIVVDDELGCPA
jgi:Domain of unknown function (DUF3291)